MDFLKSLKKNIFEITPNSFEEVAVQLFKIQAETNLIYNKYLKYLDIDPSTVQKISEIPFLPIEFFKSQSIKTGDWMEERIFKSSGTSQTGRSEHYIQDVNFYHQLSLKIAKDKFGDLSETKMLALLPSYLEQGDSSLISMMNYFINQAAEGSGFYLHNQDDLIRNIEDAKARVILFGVGYALLDLAENHKIDLSAHIIIETGGMKGRKKEITSSELHSQLKLVFRATEIHTEYGMTELLSQAYGINGNLRFPAWCRPLVRDLTDPFDLKEEGSGALNIIDLANGHSCAFIETKDLVEVRKNGEFSILGRMDNSDIRGCSLLLDSGN